MLISDSCLQGRREAWRAGEAGEARVLRAAGPRREAQGGGRPVRQEAQDGVEASPFSACCLLIASPVSCDDALKRAHLASMKGKRKRQRTAGTLLLTTTRSSTLPSLLDALETPHVDLAVDFLASASRPTGAREPSSTHISTLFCLWNAIVLGRSYFGGREVSATRYVQRA